MGRVGRVGRSHGLRLDRCPPHTVAAASPPPAPCGPLQTPCLRSAFSSADKGTQALLQGLVGSLAALEKSVSGSTRASHIVHKGTLFLARCASRRAVNPAPVATRQRAVRWSPSAPAVAVAARDTRPNVKPAPPCLDGCCAPPNAALSRAQMPGASHRLVQDLLVRLSVSSDAALEPLRASAMGLFAAAALDAAASAEAGDAAAAAAEERHSGVAGGPAGQAGPRPGSGARRGGAAPAFGSLGDFLVGRWREEEAHELALLARSMGPVAALAGGGGGGSGYGSMAPTVRGRR